MRATVRPGLSPGRPEPGNLQGLFPRADPGLWSLKRAQFGFWKHGQGFVSSLPAGPLTARRKGYSYCCPADI